ncbi:MAG: YbaB/EbfC family nucleoid-associated protein [Actinomycetota bacterium]|nr:YbaB/EbfC family nucleoid-associated protein [Actinomycetota bacterium]
MTAEFDQLVAEFEAFQARIQNVDDRFEQLAGMRSELESLEVSATSPDRSVTVVAGPGGSVLDIRLTEDAMRLGAQRLGATIMSTLQEALADAARQQAGIVQEYVGDEAPVLDQVLETQAEVMGVPVEELRDKVRPRAADDDVDDDDEAEPPVLRDSFSTPSGTDHSPADSYLRNLSDDEED